MFGQVSEVWSKLGGEQGETEGTQSFLIITAKLDPAPDLLSYLCHLF